MMRALRIKKEVIPLIEYAIAAVFHVNGIFPQIISIRYAGPTAGFRQHTTPVSI
jgi:hypothetical protein